MLVFLTMGVGYVFMTFSDPRPFFISTRILPTAKTLLAMLGTVFSIVFVFMFEDDGTTDDMTKKLLWGYVAAVGAVMTVPFVWMIAAIFGFSMILNVCGLFVFIGIVHALLGTIVAGYTISASLHAFVTGDGNGWPDIFLWKDLFELLGITSKSIQFILMIISAIISAGEVISSHFD